MTPLDRVLRLGDMLVIGTPPAKLLKALAVIADTLHPAFDRHPRIKPGWSKRSCVLCSLTVRRFLLRIGFADAIVRPVFTVMRADEDGRELHSLGIGHPEDHRAIDHHWSGHMVVTTSGYLIDTTLYPAIRPQWPELTGMVAAPIQPDNGRRIWDLPLITGLEIGDGLIEGYSFMIGWLDTPDNMTWRRGPDARDGSRRIPVVKAMIERFGIWHDEQRRRA